MPRARPMEPEDRRSQLLDSARQVFAEKGYHRASVADIIREAGVARGTFYNYFESKRAVFQAVLEGIMDDIWSVVVPIDVGQPIEAQVRLNIARIVEAVVDPAASRLLLTEAVGIDAEGDAAVRDFYARATDRVQLALVRGQRMGVVADGDMRLVARCLMGLVKEPVFQGRLAGEAPTPKELADELFRLLSGGLLVGLKG
ncbi:MAG: TetR/AcrR family transcriptional regulator [Alphaproteobacteria bacterium]|nr:TetR/AcrR family transcriptional regulator [Alphaproteobacteria bacterium]